jgi:hypothetical protein
MKDSFARYISRLTFFFFWVFGIYHSMPFLLLGFLFIILLFWWVCLYMWFVASFLQLLQYSFFVLYIQCFNCNMSRSISFLILPIWCSESFPYLDDPLFIKTLGTFSAVSLLNVFYAIFYVSLLIYPWFVGFVFLMSCGSCMFCLYFLSVFVVFIWLI